PSHSFFQSASLSTSLTPSPASATGSPSPASATGSPSPASATGSPSPASATGSPSPASATGSPASATGSPTVAPFIVSADVPGSGWSRCSGSSRTGPTGLKEGKHPDSQIDLCFLSSGRLLLFSFSSWFFTLCPPESYDVLYLHPPHTLSHPLLH
uniref:Uncharacterized protein n=1 Tax=Poecilia latipinna TaxID=48699 RepID=A0A3B3V770_9TELE